MPGRRVLPITELRSSFFAEEGIKVLRMTKWLWEEMLTADRCHLARHPELIVE